jgi:hypothetical protein
LDAWSDDTLSQGRGRRGRRAAGRRGRGLLPREVGDVDDEGEEEAEEGAVPSSSFNARAAPRPVLCGLRASPRAVGRAAELSIAALAALRLAPDTLSPSPAGAAAYSAQQRAAPVALGGGHGLERWPLRAENVTYPPPPPSVARAACALPPGGRGDAPAAPGLAADAAWLDD